MTVEVEPLEIPDVKRVHLARWPDPRGWFMETYNARRLAEAGICVDFRQDNLSQSLLAGTVRGLHYQAPPHDQAKLVSVLSGAVIDVAVDARRGSPTYGAWVKTRLSADTPIQCFVPSGFLHGFVTLSPSTVVAYKVDNHYAPEAAGAVRWNDPDLAIDWEMGDRDAVLSEKDAKAIRWSLFRTPFDYSDRCSSVR